ncbi:MAG: hypothetical protein AAFX06_15165 [Planctomycetota bacterium]
MAILFSTGLIATVVYWTLPLEVWKAILSNCCAGNGLPRPRYVVKEASGLVCFYADIAVLSVLLSIPLLALIAFAFDAWIPLSLALDSIHADSRAMASRGTPLATVQNLEWMWKLMPVIGSVSFAIVTAGLHLFSLGFERAVSDFATREFDREFRRIHHRYLRDNPPSHDSVIV